MHSQSNTYNNADSFAMIFDEEWKREELIGNKKLTKEEKIKKIIEKNKDHPFIKSSPSKAISVAKFRLRLLNLE
ncbi:hypothetical protein [Prochlorococcus marinus]|uniref:hypothetical protein n=1 Tax=Prochlorococcus marinus TaxID=1219 RepID=UPI0022B2E0D9|nr:hypothetical protein [Prochlorococcus marinus]